MLIQYGDYVERSQCRFCDQATQRVIDMGSSYPLAGGFLRNLEQDAEDERVYPLSLSFCKDCQILQCDQVVNSDVLFKQGYFYYSSTIPMLVNHFTRYAQELAKRYRPRETHTLVLEMGCNDGVFLRPLVAEGFQVIGVDPSDTVKKLINEGYHIYNDYFNSRIVNKILWKYGQVDLFVSSNSFAHIDNMKEVFENLQLVLKENGLAIIEVHNSRKIIDELNFDFIYHEHMSYYTVTSFYQLAKRFGFFLEDVEFIPVHGGSLRIYLRNRLTGNTTDKIKKILAEEKHLGQVDTYLKYFTEICVWREDFVTLYRSLREEGKTIYGYGSSGRANILCRFCDIELDQIIDDSEYKIGSYTPIYHQQIMNSQILKDKPPDYVIILAWPYSNAIVQNNLDYLERGGTFIIPLPAIELVNLNETASPLVENCNNCSIC